MAIPFGTDLAVSTDPVSCLGFVHSNKYIMICYCLSCFFFFITFDNGSFLLYVEERLSLWLVVTEVLIFNI